jgi:hypothetical protein
MTHSLIIAAVLGKVKANRSDAHMTAQNPPADPRLPKARFYRSSRLTRLSSSSSASYSSRPRRCSPATSSTTRAVVLTDYFGVGGIGGGCVNAGLLTLAAALIYQWTGDRSPAHQWPLCSWSWDSMMAASARR